MAALRYKHFQFLKNFYPSSFWWKEIYSSRCYSIYPKDYRSPQVDRSKIEQTIAEQEKDELLAVRVRPARSSQTCLANYHPDLEKFTNYVMRKGKKILARDMLEESFILVKHIQLRKYFNETDPEKQQNIIINPREIFFLAVKNATPLFSIVKIRKSGSWYKVPTGITPGRAKVAAMKWIIEASKEKPSTTPFEVSLAHELIAASQYEGKAIAKKIELHKLCESNRSYLHFWWA